MVFTDTLLFVLEIIGTVAFAVSGALKGIKNNMDLFGVSILGLITGVGGGVIRDTILGNTPATAFNTPLFTVIALCSSLFTFLVIRLIWKYIHDKKRIYDRFIMFTADTLGLAVFTTTGVRIAEESGNLGFVAIVFIAVITGVGGGVLRDILCADVPYVFKKHIYAVASAAGAAVNLLCGSVLPEEPAVILGGMTVIILRVLAALFHWNLPKINPEKI